MEALAYGGLTDLSLGELGDGLTVVLGPNEAGKSTLTALVRHVLYGFPRKNAKEPSFVPSGGARRARLVFDDADGAWTIERNDGARGGPVSVGALRGPDREGLVGELTGGVSESAFRVVFGFGLGDLAEIERAADSGDDIVGRLYAAGTGVAANPAQVRSGIEAAAAAIWAPGASTRTLNRLLAERDTLQGEVRELVAQAESFASDRVRLESLDSGVEAARKERDRLEVVRRESTRDADAVRAGLLAEEDIDSNLAVVRTEVERDQAALEALVPDDRVLDRALEIDELLAELSAHRDRLDRVRSQAEELAAVDRRIQSVSAGIGSADAASLDTSHQTVKELERWRDTLTRAESRADESERAAQDAGAWKRAAGPLPGQTAASGRRVPAYSMLAIGAASLAAGLLLSQTAATAIGATLVLAGLIFVFLPGRASDGDRDLRLRTGDLSEASRLASERAATDARALADARQGWGEWLSANGLTFAGEDPAAVVLVMSDVRGLKDLVAHRAERAADLEAERALLLAYSAKLGKAVGAFLPEAASSGPEDAAVIADRARALLETARGDALARSGLKGRLEAKRARLAELEVRRNAVAADVQKTLASHAADGLAALEVLAESAADDADRARATYESLADERSTLKGRLDTESTEGGMSARRLEIAGIQQRIADAVAEYAVLAMAARLLASTQEDYERNRQPQVIKSAEQVFCRITRDRFARVNVPMGGRSIEVYSSGGSGYTSDRLSRGTVEALYLSMRIGLISQLGEVGRSLPVLMDDILVNFDPERREGAAEAIAALAEVRQVVFFTCHPETLDVLTRVAPARTLVTLERCGP